MRLRLRMEHLAFALLGAGVALVLVANVGQVRAVTFDYLSLDSITNAGRVNSAVLTPEDAPNKLEERLEEIDDAIEVREIEQSQLLGKAIKGALTESPETLQQMRKRVETLEYEIIELRTERDAVMDEIREQPIKISTLTPAQLSDLE